MNETVQGLIYIFIILAVYFVPVWVALSKNHPHFAGIGLLNLFLGWTFVGWVGALIWANVVPRHAVAVQQ